MIHRLFFVCMCISLCSCACTIGFDEGRFPVNNARRVVVMTYNTQLLFDAVDEGTEFPEYSVASGSWSAEKYAARLDRLAQTLHLAGAAAGYPKNGSPDIVVLQEVENVQVLLDLCNRLPAASLYESALCVRSDDNDAFGIGILSRFPVLSCVSHAVWSEDASPRPLVECDIDTPLGQLTVFAVHWKSKSGADDGAGARLSQEAVLARRIGERGAAGDLFHWIACGDFNQTPQEFSLLGDRFNPWLEPLPVASAVNPLPQSGSYWYQGQWEQIDHFFLSEDLVDGSGVDAREFWCLDSSPLVRADGTPDRYEVFNGTGYSDHLPLLLEVYRYQ